MASVLDMKHFLAYNVIEFNIAEIQVLWLLNIQIWDARFTDEFSMLFIMAGWIAEMLFMLLFPFHAVVSLNSVFAEWRTEYSWVQSVLTY